MLDHFSSRSLPFHLASFLRPLLFTHSTRLFLSCSVSVSGDPISPNALIQFALCVLRISELEQSSPHKSR